MVKKTCVIPDCNAVQVGRDYCRKHYTRVWRYGDPYIVHKPQPKKVPVPKKIDFYVNEFGCFICTSHTRDKDGYPKIQVNKKPYMMSIFIYEQCFGEIPEGYVVRHTCDNPLCINPEHLIIGTNADNVRDKVERGRTVSFPGELNPMAKLTEKQVLEIRKLLKEGWTMTEIAKKFNVSRKAISKIHNRKSWTYLA